MMKKELDFSLPIELFDVSVKQPAQPTAINSGYNSSQRNIIILLALLVAHRLLFELWQHVSVGSRGAPAKAFRLHNGYRAKTELVVSHFTFFTFPSCRPAY
jgi:hypothetical protein